jgi:hypothetical protein
MKTIVALAVSIALASALFRPMAMAFPTLPADLQMVQPDPSLSKRLSAFLGKWEGPSGIIQICLIVEKIEEEKASLYIWRSGNIDSFRFPYWERREAKVIKDRGIYKIWYYGPFGSVYFTREGEYLVMLNPLFWTGNFIRVP